MQINADNSNDKFVFCLVCSYRLLSVVAVAFVFAGVVVVVAVAKGNRPLRLHRQSRRGLRRQTLRRQPGP